MLLAAPPGLVSQWDRDEGDDDEPAVVKLLPSNSPDDSDAGPPCRAVAPPLSAVMTGPDEASSLQPRSLPVPLGAFVDQLQAVNARLAMENHIWTMNAQLVLENEMLRLQWEAMGRQTSAFYGVGSGLVGAQMPTHLAAAALPVEQSRKGIRRAKKERDTPPAPAHPARPPLGTGNTPVALPASAIATGALALARAQGDALTTVMLRNVPNDYTRTMLLELLDKDYLGQYNFVYLPIDFKSGSSLGYAFVNFASSEQARRFKVELQGFADWAVASSKVCSVSWSSPFQGLAAHLERFRNSPVMHETVPDEHKPVLLENGGRVAFPPPTKAIRAPRVRPGRVHPAEGVEAFEHQ